MALSEIKRDSLIIERSDSKAEQFDIMNAFSSSLDSSKKGFSRFRKQSFNNKVDIGNSKEKKSKPTTNPKKKLNNIDIPMYKKGDSNIKWATTRQVYFD